MAGGSEGRVLSVGGRGLREGRAGAAVLLLANGDWVSGGRGRGALL